MIDALKSARKAQVTKVYDDWIDIGVPLRRDLQKFMLALDKSGADKVAGVLATSDFGALVALVLGGVAGLIGLLAGAYVLLGVTRPGAQLRSTTRSSFRLSIQERPRNATSITTPTPEDASFMAFSESRPNA